MAGLFTTASEKLAQKRKPNILILGESGIGKTWQVGTLDPKQTALLNIEAGDISIDYSKWPCDKVIDVMTIAPKLGVHPFELVLAVVMLASGGPQPAYGKEYDRATYEAACEALGGPNIFDGVKYFVIDSLTQLDALCENYIKTVRKAEVTAKSGEIDGWKASSLHKLLVSNLVKVAQQISDKSLILLAILDSKKDENGFTYYKPQFRPSVYEDIRGIMDVIGTITKLPNNDNGGKLERVLITNPENPAKFPGKNRGGYAPDIVSIEHAPGLYGVIKMIEDGLSKPPKEENEYVEKF